MKRCIEEGGVISIEGEGGSGFMRASKLRGDLGG